MFSCPIYTITRSKTLCSSLRHLSFQINQRMRGGQEPRGENATQQLGANWSSIHYSLLLGKLGLRVGAEGSYLIGGATAWSYEGLLSNLPRKGECWKKGICGAIHFDLFDESVQEDIIYTHRAPKHYVLHWNSMKPLIFNCKMPMFRSPRQTQRQKRLTKLTVASVL